MYGEVLAHQSKAAHVGGKTDQQIEARCWHSQVLLWTWRS